MLRLFSKIMAVISVLGMATNLVGWCWISHPWAGSAPNLDPRMIYLKPLGPINIQPIPAPIEQSALCYPNTLFRPKGADLDKLAGGSGFQLATFFAGTP